MTRSASADHESPQALLAGSFSLHGWNSQLDMTGVGGVWSGIVNGDGLFDAHAITGHWDLVRVLPEPGDLALAITALVAVGLVTWRRRSARKKP